MVQDSREKRIRAALGVPRGALPQVEGRWLRVYYEHLTGKLAMPFSALYTGEGGARPAVVTVTALLDPDRTADADGLFCVVDENGGGQDLPLVDIEVDVDHANFQLLDDYWYWFWNWRFDPRI